MSRASPPADPFRAFHPDEPIEPAADPIDEWLLWEEQANLVGFRTSTHPVGIEVASVGRDRVEVRQAPDAAAGIVGRFLRDGCVLFPRHPLNRDPKVAFFSDPVVERWTCRFTSSRTLVAHVGPGEALFSLKLATDHPHPDFLQPEKTKLREEATDALEWVALMARVDDLLEDDPGLVVVREALSVLVPGGETGFVVRDLRCFQDGRHYLPALSIPWVGRQIARRHGSAFEEFWGTHYAAAVGRAKARLLARYGLQYETPNPQNVLVQLDGDLLPTGTLIFRDLGDLNCATDATRASELPWTSLRAEIRPETRTSFWAFDGAGAHSVDAEALEEWCAAHDRAYFAVLREWFPALAPPAGTAPSDPLGHWNRSLRGPDAERALRAGFAPHLRR